MIDSLTSIVERKARRVFIIEVRNSKICLFCVKDEYDCVVIVSNKRCVYCHSRARILSTCEINKKICRIRDETFDIVEIIFDDEKNKKNKINNDENDVEDLDNLNVKNESKSISKKSKIDVQIQIKISTFKKLIAIKFKFFLTTITSISTNKITFSKTKSFFRQFYSIIKSFSLFAFIHNSFEFDYNSFVCSRRFFNSNFSLFDQSSICFFLKRSRFWILINFLTNWKKFWQFELIS